MENKKTVIRVDVVDRAGSNFGKMVVTMKNGLKFERQLTRAGTYRFELGNLFSTCRPTVESVQNAMRYVGADSDSVAAR